MSGTPQQIVLQLPAGLGGESADELKQLRAEVGEVKELLAAAVGRLWWSEKELAEDFGISLISMERIRRAGKIKYKRVAGKIHYTRRHIEEYLNSGSK